MSRKLPPRLPFDQWPPLDQIAWRHALDADPLKSDGGGGSHWRASTRQTFEHAYGRWLAWLAAAGLLDERVRPGARAQHETVRAYLRSLMDAAAEYTVANQLGGLGAVLSVMEPSGDFTFISRVASRIRSGAQPPRSFLEKRRPIREVFDLGQDLMGQAEKDDGLRAIRRAVLFRDGLLLCLWTLRPFRIANLGSIELGRNLAPTSRGYRLRFSATEVKNRASIDQPWPSALDAPLARYLDEHRLTLLNAAKTVAPCNALWVSFEGRGMRSASVGDAITRRTEARFGAGMGPHLMRYIVSTAVAENDPHNVYDIPSILGHTGLETSERYYNLAGGARAAEAYQDMLVQRLGEITRHNR